MYREQEEEEVEGEAGHEEEVCVFAQSCARSSSSESDDGSSVLFIRGVLITETRGL